MKTLKTIEWTTLPRTPRQAEEWLSERGITRVEVARIFDCSPQLVAKVLSGESPCRNGRSHNVAVFLGLKRGQVRALAGAAHGGVNRSALSALFEAALGVAA